MWLLKFKAEFYVLQHIRSCCGKNHFRRKRVVLHPAQMGQPRRTVWAHLLNAAPELVFGAGLSGQAARDFVSDKRVAFGDISQQAQRVLFEDVVFPRYEAAAKKRYEAAAAPNATEWDHLDAKVREIAIDLTYQQGSVWDRQMPYISGNERAALARYILETPELAKYEKAGGELIIYR
jgi:hypothetical protein